MDQAQFQIFKQQIIAAIDKHLASGGTLIAGAFGREKCLCPLSCLIADDSSWRVPTFEMLTAKLGFVFSEHEMWSFIHGFDCGINNYYDADMNKLGAELRAKYLGNKE